MREIHIPQEWLVRLFFGQITSQEFGVAALLLAQEKKGELVMSIPDMEMASGVSETVIKKWIKRWETKGWIEVRRERWKPLRRRFTGKEPSTAIPFRWVEQLRDWDIDFPQFAKRCLLHEWERHEMKVKQ